VWEQDARTSRRWRCGNRSFDWSRSSFPFLYFDFKCRKLSRFFPPFGLSVFIRMSKVLNGWCSCTKGTKGRSSVGMETLIQLHANTTGFNCSSSFIFHPFEFVREKGIFFLAGWWRRIGFHLWNDLQTFESRLKLTHEFGPRLGGCRVIVATYSQGDS